MASIRDSLFWSAVRNAFLRLAPAVVFIVLARVLSVEELGVFSAAIALFAFFEIFTEGGLSDALIQKKIINSQVLQAAFIINLIITVLVGVLVLVFSSTIESYMSMPGIGVILEVGLLSLIMNALGFVPQALLRREFKFRWLAIRAFISTGISGFVGVGLALYGAGVWSLMAQLLLMSAVNLFLVWSKVEWRPNFDFEVRAATGLLGFSINILSSRVLEYTSSRGVELYLAIFLGPAALAIYVMGHRVYGLAMQLLSAVTVDVFMPKFSQLKEDKLELHDVYYKAVEVSASLSAPFFTVLAVISPELVGFLYGDNGDGAEVVAFTLALLGSIQVIQYYNGTMLNAVGRPDVTLRILVIKSLLVLAFMAFYDARQLSDFVIIYAVVQLFGAPVSFIYMRKTVGVSLSRVLYSAAPYFISSLASLMVVEYGREVLNDLMNFEYLEFLIYSLVFFISYLLILFILSKKSFVSYHILLFKGRVYDQA